MHNEKSTINVGTRTKRQGDPLESNDTSEAVMRMKSFGTGECVELA